MRMIAAPYLSFPDPMVVSGMPLNLLRGSNMKNMERKPLEEHEVVIHVPKGSGSHVKVVENDPATLSNEITVQVSKKRKSGAMPVLGVIVK